MLHIPEIEIFKIINSLLIVIEQDFNANLADETKSILYKLFYGQKIERFDFYTEIKNIILRENNHPRKLETRMMFDAQRAHLPTIHISMPSEQKGEDGIGVDEGYSENEIDELNGKYIPIYTRAYQTTYNCIITSDNSLEVLVIYHLVKAMLISIIDSIELNGIRNIVLSGQDLQIQTDLVPTHIFSRGIGINCFYEQEIPKIQQENIVSKFQLIWTKTCIQ